MQKARWLKSNSHLCGKDWSGLYSRHRGKAGRRGGWSREVRIEKALVYLQRSNDSDSCRGFDGALVPKNDCLGGGCIPCQQKENPGAVSNGLRGA